MKKTNKNHHFILLLAALCVGLPQLASGAAAVLTADTYLNAASPGMNYGIGLNLNAAPSPNTTGAAGLLRFDLSALPAGTTSGQVKKATLRVWVSALAVAGSLDVREVLSASPDWTEVGVTKTNFDATATVSTTPNTVSLSSARQWVTADVTNSVKNWLDSPPNNYGLYLISSVTTSFDSKENAATSHPATLEIDLSGNSADFSGTLAGDVSGTQKVTVVDKVGGSTAANVNTATVTANAATNANTASTIVKRDASGNFTAGTITASLSGNATTATNATNFTGTMAGDVTGTQGVTVVGSVGGSTAANVNLATVAANSATNTNTASTIVKRDASGNFSAGTISASLSGNATNVTGTVAVANGGTGATTASAGLVNLGGWSTAGNASSASNFLGTTDNTNGLVIKVNNQQVFKFNHSGNSGETPNIIGGYSGNAAASTLNAATIAGGGDDGSTTVNSVSRVKQNRVTANNGSIGGGYGNTAGGSGATVAGGKFNTASGLESVVAGGWNNTASNDNSAVVGGLDNAVSSIYGFIGGGYKNTISAGTSVILGGHDNSTNMAMSMILGGHHNVINNSGQGSLAAGVYANVTHGGVFLWSDNSYFLNFNSAALNEFAVRATGGVRFVTAVDSVTGDPTAGVAVANGGGSWSSLSDRNAKENFAPVNGREVLEKVAALPIQTWNYKTQADGIRHIGPMAQDFKAAFKVGENDTTISTIDPDGVALAAVQGLYQLVKQQQAEITELKTQRQADAQTQQAIIAELRAQNQKVLDRLQKVESKFIYTQQ